MKIDLQEVSINTCAVEIRLMTISGKQVTLAVFKQLKNEGIVDFNDMKLCGKPWGIVNYFPPGCRHDHLHIVWQLDDELRRSCVYKFDDDIHGGWIQATIKRRVRQMCLLETDEVFREMLETQEQAYRMLYDDLYHLPQLFIAV